MGEHLPLLKTLRAKTETSTEQAGEFTALVSVFGNEDAHGDIIDPGAFTRSLDEWATKGRNIPVIWSHQWDDPDSFIGEFTRAEETEHGLLMTGLLDIEDNPRAERVHRLMQAGRIVEFSIGGRVREWKFVKHEDALDTEFHITDLDLYEAGPCFKGANRETELVSVKALAAKAEQAQPDPADPEPATEPDAADDAAPELSTPTGEDARKTDGPEPVSLPLHVRTALELIDI